MDIGSMVLSLYEKDTSSAYKNLQALEALSENEDVLYPYLDEFIAMLRNDTYVLRVRGFRLLCKQAKWDSEKKIDAEIDLILGAVDDEKPTAVRQALQALQDIVLYKQELHEKIRQMAQSLDYSRFKDTMQPLIHKHRRPFTGHRHARAMLVE